MSDDVAEREQATSNCDEYRGTTMSLSSCDDDREATMSLRSCDDDREATMSLRECFLNRERCGGTSVTTVGHELTEKNSPSRSAV